MSLLDLDEWLIDLAEHVELVYSPIADAKQFPEAVDLTLIEGAVANDEHVELLKLARRNSTTLIAFGDCAVTGNVTALRNSLGPVAPILQQVYIDHGDPNGVLPSQPGIVPVLLDRVHPLHALVPIDLFLPGCPPPAPRIRAVLEALLAGEAPPQEGAAMIRFG
jgi:NAD-reducing hydrogenase small subunit